MTTKPTPRKPHIVFYFSDTGGGHRSAAEAIIEAINIEYKNKVTTEMVDFFKDYAPRPFNRVGDMYPYMVKAPQLWSASFHATDGRAQARAITATMWPLARHAAKTLVKSHPADLIVTVHPFANTFALKALAPTVRLLSMSSQIWSPLHLRKPPVLHPGRVHPVGVRCVPCAELSVLHGSRRQQHADCRGAQAGSRR